jgi:hypothetical protein
MQEFYPENDLEKAILDAKIGARPLADVMERLATANLYISSKTEVEKDGAGFTPLLLGQATKPLIAAFSSLSRPALHARAAEYILQMKGAEFLKRVPSGCGVVLNPGYKTQLVISEDAIPR